MKKTALNKKRGFTLIEVLIALVILSGATIIMSRIWAGNQQRVRKIADYHKVVYLMEKKITELEFEWRKKNFNYIPKEEKGDFKEEQYFSWSVKTQPLKLPDLQKITSLTGQNNEIINQVVLVTSQLLSQSVLEAKLTIHYKRGALKSAYSLTTYIVDHNKEVKIPKFR